MSSTQTITNTISQTFTNTKNEIKTNTIYETSITTEQVTVTTEIPGATVTVTSADIRLKKRQQTVSPAYIPTYATAACKNIVAYSSACSCIGVTKRTTTVPQRTVTTYATSTASFFETKTTTTATVDRTVVDNTVKVLTTDATATSANPQATSTVVEVVPLRQNMAIKAFNVSTGQELGYLYPGLSPRSNNYGSISPTPYRFFVDANGVLTSAYGQAGVEYYSDFHAMALRQTPTNFYILKFTLASDGTFSNWGIDRPDRPNSALFSCWYAPGALDRYTVMVDGNVPLSAPAGVGWTNIYYKAVPFFTPV